MKALALFPPDAEAVLSGSLVGVPRVHPTAHRGPVLLVEVAANGSGGLAVGVADLTACGRHDGPRWTLALGNPRPLPAPASVWLTRGTDGLMDAGPLCPSLVAALSALGVGVGG